MYPKFLKRVQLQFDEILIGFTYIAFEKEFINGKNKLISKRMLKRFFKKIGISYKRGRRSIFKDSKWKTYWEKLSQITSVKGFVEKGLCDLYFFDESGFSLDSNVPYTWSEVGKPTKVPSDRYAKKINVLGFLNTKNKDLFYEMKIGSVNSETTVKLFDKFANKINNLLVCMEALSKMTTVGVLLILSENLSKSSTVVSEFTEPILIS